MITFNNYKKRDYYFVLLVIILVQLILGFQGFDVCDDGFVLTAYQQLFHNPETITYNFVYYLSVLFGATWYEIYPDGGIFWFRLLTVLVNTFCFIVAFQIFKKVIAKRIALLGLTMVLFVNDFGFLTFYHNHLTVLLALLSVWFLQKGIFKNHMLFIFFSGFFIGLNVFTRIPNLTLFAFILVIPYVYYLQNNLKKAFKPIFFYILGIIVSVVVTLLILVFLNHLQIFKTAILSLVDLGKTDGSAHNVISLAYVYIDNYLHLLTYVAQLCLVFICLVLIHTLLKPYLILKKVAYLGVVLSCIIWVKHSDIYLAYVLSYVGVIFIILKKQRNIHLKFLAFLGLLMLLVLPLGSGGGIVSSGYMCIWLSLPLYLAVLHQISINQICFKLPARQYNLIINPFFFKQITIITAVLFLSVKGYNISKQAYFDVGSRLKKTYAIQNKLAKHIYTKERRATIINDLLQNMQPFVKKGDYILAYDKIPMIHFLTETKPYMYNPWVWIYDSHSFKKNLEKAEAEINVYPVIIQQKMETIFSFSEPIPNYMTTNPKLVTLQFNGYDAKRNQLMINFISRNAYKLVWSNSYFNIYKTAKTHR